MIHLQKQWAQFGLGKLYAGHIWTENDYLLGKKIILPRFGRLMMKLMHHTIRMYEFKKVLRFCKSVIIA